MDQPSHNQVTFSIIMPVYDHADYLAEAVRSVMDQTRKDWELIIVDDGSTDGSGELADRLAADDGRIIVIHQKNAGPAAARNTALAKARGRWLAYIDSDDVYMPDALQKFADYISERHEAKFVYGYRYRIGDGANENEKEGGEYQDRTTGTVELFGRMYLSHLCVCYRRELIDQAGPYDASLRSCEDYELYLRMSLHCHFEPIGKPTGYRRRHGGNISRQTGHSQILEAEVLRRFIDKQGGRDIIPPELVISRLGRIYYRAGRQYFKSRCYRQAIKAFRMAHRYGRTFKGVMLAALARLLLPLGRNDGRPMPMLQKTF